MCERRNRCKRRGPWTPSPFATCGRRGNGFRGGACLFRTAHHARAKVRHRTQAAPASRSASLAANSVAPVVHTSSTSSTLRGSVAPGSACMLPSMFARRAARESLRWSKLCGRRSTSMQAIPSSSATACASSSAWSNPLLPVSYTHLNAERDEDAEVEDVNERYLREKLV